MSSRDEYEAIYRRIEDLAGIDRTPRLLAQINALEPSDYEERLELLLDIGYMPTNYSVWGNLDVFSQCEWTNLLFGLEPMKPDVQFPNPDDFDVLIRTVGAWLVVNRLIGDQLRYVSAAKISQEIIKKDRDAIPNNSYSKTDLLAATSAVFLPVPRQLGHLTDKSVLSSDEKPNWILRKIAGGIWEVGNKAQPEKLKAVTGFMDMAFAIRAEGKELSPLELPGNRSEESDIVRVNLASSPESRSDIGSVDGKIPDDQAWTGFGSDDVADKKARTQYRVARQKLIAEVETAIETGNTDAAAEAQSCLDELEHYMSDVTMPGGRSRKLSKGDLIEKATAAARDRKATALNKLKEAGLHDMVSHLRDYYKTRKREVAYIKGYPFPHWILE